MKTNVLLILLGISLCASSCLTQKKATKHRKSYMERTYTSIKDALNDADVQLLSDTVKVIFKSPVMFEFNKADISSTLFPSFERFARILNEKKKTTIMITGHTDSVGGDNTNNMTLSVRRADSAKNLLAHYKLAPSRIYTWGMGAKEPVATNATDEGRAKNRRIEFVILYDYKP
jgi:outer membrane protein OmpA-like peptidoglycan-associated protein